MKLLIADKLEQEAIVALKEIQGLEVISNPTLAKEDLPSALDGVNILVVRSKEVRRAAIEAGKSLALIVRAGAGTNTIDVEAASERGVYVANCPGKNAIAVAELAIGMILAIDRRLPDATRTLQAGAWEKGEFGKADGLYGKRLGIAGFGAIGREVTHRARALGMKVHGYDVVKHHFESHGAMFVPSLEELAAQSDVFSIHLPLTKDTRHAINAKVLGALPQRAIVVNTSRSEVLDYDALAEAIKTRGLRVGLDVFPSEPEGGKAQYTHPILASASVATPHIGASTQQAQLAIAAETVRIVRSFLESGDVPNCVNVSAGSPARCQLVVRHYDRVGVLATVLAVIKRHGINVGEMTNSPFAGNKAACAKLRLAQFPSAACLAEIEGSSSDVIHVEAIPVSA